MKTNYTIRVATAAFIFVVAQICGLAQASSPCPRFPAGSSISQPQDLFSEHGVLRVNFTYETTVDQYGNTSILFHDRRRCRSRPRCTCIPATGS